MQIPEPNQQFSIKQDRKREAGEKYEVREKDDDDYEESLFCKVY